VRFERLNPFFEETFGTFPLLFEMIPTFEQNQEILQSTLTTFACTPELNAVTTVLFFGKITVKSFTGEII
jgi:hypothetical protein